MKVIARKFYDKDGIEAGVILTAVLLRAISTSEKGKIEGLLEQHCFEKLFPSKGLNIYKEINEDTASITAFVKMNSLEDEMIVIGGTIL